MLELSWRRIFVLILIFTTIILAQDYGQQRYQQPMGPAVPMHVFAQCRWVGSGPFCDGECPSGMEATGHSKSCDDYSDHPACAMLYFGSSCWTGHKRLCCPEGFASGCRWFGTAPFCDGECPTGGYMELTRKEECENSQYWPCSIRDFGDTCSTGTKAYCCPLATMPGGNNMNYPPPNYQRNDDYYQG